MKGSVRVYSSTDRDSLLASLLDGVRASGNQDFCIKMSPTKRGLRLGPFSAVIDEEVESLHVKFIHEIPPNYGMNELLVRFNVNIPYSGLINAITQDVFINYFAIYINFVCWIILSIIKKGLFAENKDKMINNSLTSLKDFEPPINCPIELLEQEFHVLRRLIASKSGYKAFTALPK